MKGSGKTKHNEKGSQDLSKQSITEKFFAAVICILVFIMPILALFCFRTVKEYKRAIVLRFGRIRSDSPAGPGILWLPPSDTFILIDLRTQSFNLPEQEILTKDSVTVTVDAVAYFHVQEPMQSFLNVQSYKQATHLVSVSILRNILGQHTLTELLSDRVPISHFTRSEINKVTSEWGVEMERVDIKDIILPFDLQKAMAAEAEGTRIGKAKIIEAEGEIKAAENLREASRIMMENPQTILLRYLQTLNYIAGRQKTSIVFPFPLELPEPDSMQAARRKPL